MEGYPIYYLIGVLHYDMHADKLLQREVEGQCKFGGTVCRD